MTDKQKLNDDISKLLKSGAYIPYSYNILVGVICSILLIVIGLEIKKIGNLQDSVNEHNIKLATIETTITNLNVAVLKIDELDDELQEHILLDAQR